MHRNEKVRARARRVLSNFKFWTKMLLEKMRILNRRTKRAVPVWYTTCNAQGMRSPTALAKHSGEAAIDSGASNAAHCFFAMQWKSHSQWRMKIAAVDSRFAWRFSYSSRWTYSLVMRSSEHVSNMCMILILGNFAFLQRVFDEQKEQRCGICFV